MIENKSPSKPEVKVTSAPKDNQQRPEEPKPVEMDNKQDLETKLVEEKQTSPKRATPEKPVEEPVEKPAPQKSPEKEKLESVKADSPIKMPQQ